MSVKIRLKRMGTRGKPFYRMVVADSRSPRDGRFIEMLGYYNPLTDPPTIKINEEKALLWLGRGAQPSDTCEALLKHESIFQKFLASKGTAPEAAVVEEPVAEAAPARKKKTKAVEEPVAEVATEAAAPVEPEVAEVVATVEPEAVEEEKPTE